MSDLIKQTESVRVQVQVKRPKRFKAGAELSGAVNLAVELEENPEFQDFKLQVTVTESTNPCKED